MGTVDHIVVKTMLPAVRVDLAART